MKMEGILSVSEITEALRRTLSTGFPFVWVCGEVTNVSRAASGHIYFALKDSFAQLQCVWFAQAQKRNGAGTRFDPLTGEVYENEKPDPREQLENGKEFICAGPIGIYASRGQYQLQVEFIQISGTGNLARAFEELKTRLASLGYFDHLHKKKLPNNPEKIALVTSPHGAAIHDFLRVSNGRGLSAIIRLFPVPVQGVDASRKIADALYFINKQNWADLIVIIRGGGSLEDLWAFNEEVVAEAIFNSRIPVITGIGHEIDTTIADLVADMRAATPTHAAQLLWPDRIDMIQRLDELSILLNQIMRNKMETFSERVKNLEIRLNLLSPVKRLEIKSLKLDGMINSLQRAIKIRFKFFQTAYELLAARIARSELISEKLKINIKKLEWLNGSLEKTTLRKLKIVDQDLKALSFSLRQVKKTFLNEKAIRLRELEVLLKSRNPEAPLQRGFALLMKENKIIKSVDQVNHGQKIMARISDGKIELEVLKKFSEI